MRRGATLRVGAFMARRAITRGNIGVFVMTVAMMSAVFMQLVFVPSLIEGAKEQVERQLRDNVTANITVAPGGSSLVIADPGRLVADALALPEVAAATPTVLAGTQLSTRTQTGSWSILAIDPESYGAVFMTQDHMTEGRFLESGDTDGIVLGIGIAGADRTELATYLNSLRSVHVGDTVTVAMLGGISRSFTVVGIYDTGMSQVSLRAFVTRTAAEQILPPLAGQVSTIFIRTHEVGTEAAVIAALSAERPDVTYEPWQSLDAAIAELTGSFDIVGAILSAVSLVVAVIVVLIVTYIDLVSKRRTIGIERAIGISGPAIRIAYVIKAAVFAVIGAALGALLFRFAAAPLVAAYPFSFPVGPVTLSVSGVLMLRDALILIVVAMIGALAPAWRTTRMDLLKAIWG